MARYSVADWYGVVTPGGVALLPHTVPLGAVERVWQALKEGSGPGAVIEGLVGTFGAALRNLPDFALLSLAENGGARIALRGAVTARLLLGGTASEHTFSGGGVSTWTEQLVTDVERAELSVSGSSGECILPIADGIVLAGRVVFWLNEAGEQRGGVSPAGRKSEQSDAAADPGPMVAAVVAAPVAALEPHFLDDAGDAPAAGPGGVQPAGAEPESVPAELVTSLHEPPDDKPALVADEPVGAEPEPVNSRSEPVGVIPAVHAAETLVAEDAPNDYDRLLYGETVLSSVEDAAVRPERADVVAGEPQLVTPPPPPPLPASTRIPPPPPPPPPSDPAAIIALPTFTPAGGASAAPEAASWQDHDGETVLVEALLSGQQPGVPVASVSPDAAWRPPRLLVPGQASVVLDRSAIIGVRPRFTRAQDGKVPLLITVDSPKGEISRSHLEFRLEGRTLLAVDLNSTNGTILLREGCDPVRLHPNDPSILVPGDRIDLGDDVMLEFEDLV